MIDLSRHPATCVRLDRKVVYVGQPGADESCPAHAAGRRQAILLGARPAPAAHPRTPPRSAHTASAVYTGEGFDACTAPSSTTMTDWMVSPYRAIGIYVGGENMACAQPNLTAGWVSAEVAAGWHLIPTYVGLQGPGACGGGCSTISSSQAAAQGRAAADDAVAHVGALGIPTGNPIYYDMEGYNSGSSSTHTVLTFLSAWTSQLHADSYLSGVYSSAASGISDLVSSMPSHSIAEPDDIWIAHWNGQATTSDSYVPAGYWNQHQRIHQYRGGHDESYGGKTLNIDNDYLDAATADTQGTTPTSPSVMCVVPELQHLKYRAAKRSLKLAHCTLGKVHWPRHWRRHRHRLRVVSQSPKAGSTKAAGYPVRIRLAVY